MNQKGYSPLSLLLLVGLGIFILWELNYYFNYFSDLGGRRPVIQENTVCLTGEDNNCNDSNDVFILE